MIQDIKHKWKMFEEEWFMVCIDKNKQFKTDWEWKESGGICKFCGAEAVKECKQRKLANELYWKKQREQNNRSKNKLLKEYL